MKKSARDSIGIAMLYAESDRIRDNIAAHDPATDFDNTELSNILNMQGNFTLSQANQVLTDQITTMNPFYENDNGKKAFLDPNDQRFAYGLFWSCDAGLTMGENVDDHDEQLTNLKFYAPAGTNLWTDNFAIPTYAKNTDAAYAFINYLLTAENAAANIDYVGSQMAATGDAIDDLKADYGVPENVTTADIFDDFDINYACAIFPTADNITYSAIMHNFDAAKEREVNKLMLDIQNRAAELTESDGGAVNWFLVVIALLALAAFVAWVIYRCTHLRPKTPPTTK